MDAITPEEQIDKGRSNLASSWTDERVALLRELKTQALSNADIAQKINEQTGSAFSRNAVVGKAMRGGIDGKTRKGWRPSAPRSRTTKTRAERIGEKIEVARLELPPAPASDLEIPKKQRRTLLQLKNTSCRWPVGHPRDEGFFFCGSPEANLDAGRPYCPHHAFRSCARSQPVAA